MINQNLQHASGITGTIDAVAVYPDGSALVRISDRWFLAAECGKRFNVLPRWIKV